MSSPQFDVERATAGLVLALFLAASLLVAAMFYFVLRDTKKRAETSNSPQAVRAEHPSQTTNVAPAPSPIPEAYA